jgi:hypothetical protein
LFCWTFSDVPTFPPYFLIFKIYMQTNELYQLASVAFCLLLAWVSFFFVSFVKSYSVLVLPVHWYIVFSLSIIDVHGFFTSEYQLFSCWRCNFGSFFVVGIKTTEHQHLDIINPASWHQIISFIVFLYEHIFSLCMRKQIDLLCQFILDSESDMRWVSASIMHLFYIFFLSWSIFKFHLHPCIYNILYVDRLMLCLCIYQCSDYFGLSLELGSFLAGVMISTTDFAHHTLEQVLFCIQFNL